MKSPFFLKFLMSLDSDVLMSFACDFRLPPTENLGYDYAIKKLICKTGKYLRL